MAAIQRSSHLCLGLRLRSEQTHSRLDSRSSPRHERKNAQPGATANGPAGPWLISNVGQRKMKPVPQNVIQSSPPGTEWFGGSVDRSTMSLRVGARARGTSVDKKEVSALLGCDSCQERFR